MRDRKRPKTAQAIDHRKLPVGKLISPPVKGDFLCLPLLGWVGVREKVDTPLVLLALMLFKSLEDVAPRGTLQIELPVHEETKLATVAALERFGWDGRIWPRDEGWPPADSDDETNLQVMIAQAELSNTLVFPSDDEGTQAQQVKVSRARGPFLMPPLPKPETDPDPMKVEKLTELCNNPSLFYPIGRYV